MKTFERRLLFTSGLAAAMFAVTGAPLQAGPKRGGILRAALSAQRDHDDWHQTQSPFIQVARGAVFETLTCLSPAGVVIGDIARSWKTRQAGLIWEFELNENVIFHDGIKLHLRDVFAMFERFEQLNVDRVKALGTDRFEVVLKTANPNFPYDLTHAKYAILPAQEARQNQGIGTGVYQVHKFQAGRHFIGQRVAQHRKDGQEGWFERIELSGLASLQMRREALRDALVDVVDAPQVDSYSDPAEYTFLPQRHKPEVIVRNSIAQPSYESHMWQLDHARIATNWWML